MGKQEKGKNVQSESQKNQNEVCYRCGVEGHWSRTCRTPRHLVELYQPSIKDKGKKKEMNFTDYSDVFDDTTEPADAAHLDVAEFFTEQSGELN